MNTNRIINRNSSRNDKIHIRKARFEELRELWAQLNRKYVLYFDKAIDKKIEAELPSIINDKHVFSLQTVESSRKVLEFEGNVAVANEGAHAELTLHDRHYGYNEFLKRASRYTNIPIHILHKAICEAANGGYHLTNEMFNDSSLTRLIGAVDDWKCDQLVGFVRYKQANYTVKETKLTNADGTVKDEVVQAYIGNKSVPGEPPVKYLYDAYAHDSGLELQNIKTEIDEVIVYGKIPSHSICIPTVASSNYSPDFMYVVKKSDGSKELNIVIETKAYDKESHISPDEDTKISCAEEFFKAMTANGYTTNVVDKVISGYSAENSGIVSGDEIQYINGEKIVTITDVKSAIARAGENKIKITVKDNSGNIKEVELTPTVENGTYYIGIQFKVADNTISNRIYYSAHNTKLFIKDMAESVKMLVTGKTTTEQLTGPIGISQVVAQTNGIKQFVYVLIVVSMSLGVTNLIPFPPLDGGKILLLIIEGIRRKPLDNEVEAKLQLAGFAVLITLSIFVTYNDILRIF